MLCYFVWFYLKFEANWHEKLLTILLQKQLPFDDGTRDLLHETDKLSIQLSFGNFLRASEVSQS